MADKKAPTVPHTKKWWSSLIDLTIWLGMTLLAALTSNVATAVALGGSRLSAPRAAIVFGSGLLAVALFTLGLLLRERRSAKLTILRNTLTGAYLDALDRSIFNPGRRGSK